MNCCNDFDQCTQGAHCPVRATAGITPAVVAPIKARTCAELGVCLSRKGQCVCTHKLPEPTGIILLDEPDAAPYPSSFDRISYGLAVGLACAGSFLTVMGLAGYTYARFCGA